MGNRRIWCGVGIMVVGACAAWPFRKTLLPEADAPIPAADVVPLELIARPALPTKLTHVNADERSPAAELDPSGGLEPLASALDRGVPRRAVVKIDESTRLPPLAADYATLPNRQTTDPRSAVLRDANSSPALTAVLDPPRNQRRYRIGKHDTLEAIAERLLGSRQHADKLLAANPGVILVPEILPVGATIVIPDLNQAAETMVRLPEAGE